ncbi:MAG: FTR1 family protein [Thermoanaerobaculia bacterium]
MLQALIIVFREGFESFLTVAIIFAYLKKTGRDWLRPAVWWGIGAAVVVSAALGYWLKSVTNQPLWEGIVALVAAVLVATFVIHIWRIAPTMKREMEAKLEARASNASAPWAWVGIFILTVLMIAREGMETALLLIQVRQGNFWLGCAIGTALAASMAWIWAHYGHRVNLKRFFQVTGLFLLLFTVQILFYAVHEFSEAELLPNSEAIHVATEPYSADGRYGLWIMFGMVAICALWLAGVTALDRIRAHGRGPIEA